MGSILGLPRAQGLLFGPLADRVTVEAKIPVTSRRSMEPSLAHSSHISPRQFRRPVHTPAPPVRVWAGSRAAGMVDGQNGQNLTRKWAIRS